MRRIRLTEEQLVYCLKHTINEAMNGGAGIPVAAKTDSNGKVTQTSLTQQSNELKNRGLNNAQITVDQDTLAENETVYTKKELKEARRRKLVAESKKTTKKAIDKKMRRK